ncbi:MAG: Thioesterase superfamily [Acidimicrobiales bacterium]|nr:Thioesterase superfamily [Acidimicrobiales bacterium]
MPVKPGLTASVELTVTSADTAEAIGSGDVPVISTPRVVALCEQAAVNAVVGQLLPGQTSVGWRIQLDHLAPTAVGHVVVAEAKLDKIEGRRLCFSVSVNDDRGLIAAGRVTRVVVERDRFLDRTV